MPTRRIAFDEWKKRDRVLPPGVRAGRRPGPKRRPRNPDEWAALLEIALERRRQYIACGKLEVLPDGNYRFELGQEKLVTWLEQND